jgi:hypothetical protein
MNVKNVTGVVCLDELLAELVGCWAGSGVDGRRSRAPPDEVAALEAAGPLGHGGRGDQDATVHPGGVSR